MIISPDYPHFRKSTWPEFASWLPWNQVTEHHKTANRITFRNGTVVYYGGIDDPDSWRGPNVNWIWFDEAARKKTDAAWKVLIGCLRVGPEPKAWITTTPSGSLHWSYQYFVMGKTPPEVAEALALEGIDPADLYSYCHASVEDNRANLDPLFYASLLASYTGKYRKQELEGLFVSFEGLVYEEFSPENIGDGPEFDHDSSIPVEWAVDDGYTNPRVILFLQLRDNGDVVVFDEVYRSRQKAEETIDEALDQELHPWPKAEFAAVDSSAAELVRRLTDADIVARGSTHQVVEGIKVVRRLVLDGNGHRSLRVHRRCENLIREMQCYCYPEGKDSRNESEKPEKSNDHTPDALRYWTWMRARWE